MKKVIEEKFYRSNRAENLFSKVDFTDTFSTTNHQNTIDEVAELIFLTYPKWVMVLFKIRNALVRLIGLKTEIPDDFNNEKYKGFFKVYDTSEYELVLGADDKHLNFRAVITNTKEKEYNIKLTTLVVYNNFFGKLYMTIINPFHRLVVKKMLSQAFTIKK